MRRYSSLFWYVTLFLSVFALDRVTKFFVLKYQYSHYHVTSFLSFNIVFNRGFSWGICDSQDSFVFFIVSATIFLITVGLGFFAWRRYSKGHMIIGETVAVAGSLSNIIDRIFYGGVVDFIVLSFGKFSWPIFNFADFFIFFGILLVCCFVWFENN